MSKDKSSLESTQLSFQDNSMHAKAALQDVKAPTTTPIKAVDRRLDQGPSSSQIGKPLRHPSSKKKAWTPNRLHLSGKATASSASREAIKMGKQSRSRDHEANPSCPTLQTTRSNSEPTRGTELGNKPVQSGETSSKKSHEHTRKDEVHANVQELEKVFGHSPSTELVHLFEFGCTVQPVGGEFRGLVKTKLPEKGSILWLAPERMVSVDLPPSYVIKDDEWIGISKWVGNDSKLRDEFIFVCNEGAYLIRPGTWLTKIATWARELGSSKDELSDLLRLKEACLRRKGRSQHSHLGKLEKHSHSCSICENRFEHEHLINDWSDSIMRGDHLCEQCLTQWNETREKQKRAFLIPFEEGIPSSSERGFSDGFTWIGGTYHWMVTSKGELSSDSKESKRPSLLGLYLGSKSDDDLLHRRSIAGTSDRS